MSCNNPCTFTRQENHLRQQRGVHSSRLILPVHTAHPVRLPKGFVASSVREREQDEVFLLAPVTVFLVKA